MSLLLHLTLRGKAMLPRGDEQLHASIRVSVRE